MNQLPLDSLLIENFRLIRHLEIPTLARVNLLVGKNSVGKSTILEALHLFAKRNHQTIWAILEAREEGTTSPQTSERKIQSLRYLFAGRPDLSQQEQEFVIGSQDIHNQLTVQFQYMSDMGSSEFFQGDRDEVFPTSLQFSPILTIAYRGQKANDEFNINRPVQNSIMPLHIIFVSATSLDEQLVKQLWGRIALTPRKQVVIEALRTIMPDVEDLGIINNPELGENELTAVKLRHTETPIPLRSLGEGATRLFAIILALVNSANGLLLIDEIESGLHYSVQHTLWQIIFDQAHKLNVQVFATTHSNDCINTFQEIANQHEEEGLLIRLERRQGDIVAVSLNEEALSVAAEQAIEVR